MKTLICETCGSRDFIKSNNQLKCAFCNTIYYIEDSDPKSLQEISKPKKESNISINDDVQRLLKKCEKEPWNARKYANRILDIDATNQEALKYL